MEIYENDQGDRIGTSDSRMSVTVMESADHIEFQITLIGEIYARAFFFAMVYDTAVLRLTDPTYTFEVPDGNAVNNVGYPVLTIPQSFLDNHIGYNVSGRQHFPINDGPCLGMKMFCPSMGVNIIDATIVQLPRGEMIHLFSMYLKKVNPGTPLSTSDFGYYVQTAAVPMLPMQSPSWMFGAFDVRFAPAQPWSAYIANPDLFTYRSPSSVTTENATNLTDVSATLNASFSRGNFHPTNDIVVSEFNNLYKTTPTHRLNWDTISRYGFIYSDVDAEISMDGFSKKLKVDGTIYDFPTPAEIAAGVFIRNGKTFHIQHPTNNSTANQDVSFSQNIVGLIPGESYYAWSYIFYSFETSNEFLNVGNKIMFQTSPNLYVNVENFNYCDGEEVPEYTFTGSDDTDFLWERIVGQDFGLSDESGINTIPAFVATNYGFEAISAIYKVTPSGGSNYHGEPQYFLITVNPRPVTSPVEDMVYCNGTTAPRFDFTCNIPDAYYEWEFVNETGSTMIPGVPASGENYIPGFEAYNTGNEPLIGKYRVRASYSYANLTCYAYEWEYFNIVILPTPGIPTVTPVAQELHSGQATAPITFTGNVADVTYVWSFSSGDMLPDFPTNGEGNIPSYLIQNDQLLPLSANYEVAAVLNFGNYPAYACESNKAAFSITVYPTPYPDPIPNFVYCNGETAPTYSFTGSNTLANYYWEFVSGANFGIPTSGSNVFPTFVTMNNGSTPLIANYRVRAVLGNYNSEWVSFGVIVLPTPTVVSNPAHQTICSGGTTLPVMFSGNVTAATYSWARVSGNIPELPISGIGAFSAYTLENTGSTSMEVVYEVTPKLNYSQYPGHTCPGDPTQFSITVLPQPQINTIPEMAYCNGEWTPNFEFGNVSGVSYTWELVNGVNVGLAANGTGQLPSFIAQNNTHNEILEAIYEVTASYSMYGLVCTHSVTFSIFVNPTPSVELNIGPYQFCANEETPVIDLVAAFGSMNNIEGTVYEWNYISANDIGLKQTFGTNEIPSFVTVNNTNQQVTALLSVKAHFNQCYSVEKNFKIIVEPMPAIVSQTDAGTICSGGNFEYVIKTSFPVNTISWERAPHPDINNNEGASGNTDFITEKLYNTGYSDVTVTYLITLATGECEYVNVGEVNLVVKPDFDLSIPPVTEACKGELHTTIKYDIEIPGIEYTLVFDPTAVAEGWESVTNFIPLPESEIKVMIPAGAKVGNYNATLTLHFGNCTSTYDIVIMLTTAPVVTAAADTDIILCENESLYLFVEVEGDVEYQWYFEDEIIPNATSATYEGVFDETKGGVYSVEISNECGAIRYYFNVTVNPVVIELKWDDVMYMDNSTSVYVAYQWYKNGNPIAVDGQSQYYTEAGGFTPFAEYTLRAYKADGSYDESCPIVPNDGTKGTSGLTIYPNPSITGNIVTFLLQLPDGEAPDADVLIFDMNSKLVTQFIITSHKTEVKLEAASGTYLVKVTTKSGTEFIEKIIIQKQ
jgi:hypothetical protein